jgi:hypothetical protein
LRWCPCIIPEIYHTNARRKKMSPDEQKMKRGVVAELRDLLKRMDVDSLEDTLHPKGELDVEIITPEAGKSSLEKALPHPSTALDIEAVEGSDKEGMEGAEPKYPSSEAVMSNAQKMERGITKKKEDEE